MTNRRRRRRIAGCLMWVLLVQTILAAAGCVALFLLWRRIGSFGAPAGLIVGVGLLIRLIAGELLFWISWLQLPLGRSLQLGNGMWFFASDATLYYHVAVTTAAGGVPAIVHVAKTEPSVFFIQLLSAFCMLFGTISSVALLLNGLSYLGTCLVILLWARYATQTEADQPLPRGVVFAIAAITFSPAAILWSLQPLKDTFFVFLIVLFIGLCVMWQSGWQPATRVRTLIASALMMAAVMFALAGIRWYVALAVLGAATLAFMEISFVVNRHFAAAVIGLALCIVLLRIILVSAGPYIPESLHKSLEFERLV
ncbi:MAG TPA: hypothetical protein VF836_08100, partial [Gemmatimonadaceae bacterium]